MEKENAMFVITHYNNTIPGSSVFKSTFEIESKFPLLFSFRMKLQKLVQEEQERLTSNPCQNQQSDTSDK